MKSFISILLFAITINSYASVSAKELGAIDNSFAITKDRASQFISNLPDTDDYIEGKLIASYISLVEDKVNSIEQQLNEINDLNNVDETQLENIADEIEELQELIENY